MREAAKFHIPSDNVVTLFVCLIGWSVAMHAEGIYLKDFLLWLDQHPELANSDHDANLMGNDDDAGSTVDNDLTARYHKASKKALSFECDELLRLNHSE